MLSTLDKYKHTIKFIGVEFPSKELRDLVKITELPKILVATPNAEDPKDTR